MIDHRQLLSQSERLARLDPKRPQQGNLRRAVSTAYYAIFHFLIDQACRTSMGTAVDRRPYRDVLARAFQHTTMASACKSFSGGTLPESISRRLPSLVVPADLRSVAHTFCEAQEKRHLADYDPAERFSRADVIAQIRDIDQAISRFIRIRGQNETRFFLSCLLTWSALAGRK